MKYRGGYKYQLVADEVFETSMAPAGPIETMFIRMDAGGRMTVKTGYAWDGASGPTIDTKSTMRASLVHDAIYQLIRQHYLQPGDRKRADELLREIMVEDGGGGWLAKVRAWYYYQAVRKFGGLAARKPKTVHEAP